MWYIKNRVLEEQEQWDKHHGNKDESIGGVQVGEDEACHWKAQHLVAEDGGDMEELVISDDVDEECHARLKCGKEAQILSACF